MSHRSGGFLLVSLLLAGWNLRHGRVATTAKLILIVRPGSFALQN